MKVAIASLLIAIMLIAGCKSQQNDTSDKNPGENMKEVFLKTQDNVQIRGTHYPGKGDGVILLHMLPTDRNEWRQFAIKLNNLGYNVIAIDYRWQTNPNAVYKDAVMDVKAARDFLNSSKILIIGSSIGANLALNYAVDDEDVDAIVLLSPGENYHDVATFDAMKQYNRAVLIVASEDDKQSINASRKLYALAFGEKEIKIYPKAGHGTNMFSQPDLADFIIDWLDKHR